MPSVSVFSGSGGAAYAAFISHTLRENGIENVVEAEGVTEHPLSMGPKGRYEILVRPEDVARAHELLAGLEEELASDEEETEPEPIANRGVQSLTEREKKWFLYLAVVFGVAAVWFCVLAIRRGGSVVAMTLAVSAASGAVFSAFAARGPR